MTQPHDNNTSALIDAYLDGDMSVEQRADFQNRLETDAELRRQVDLQNRIDGRLRVLMDPPPYIPAAPAVAGKIEPRRQFGPQWLGVAAVLVLGILGVWALVVQPWHGLLGPARSDVAASAYLQRAVATGFKPIWVCESDDVFAKYTQDKLGVSFLVKPRAGVELVGWTYASGLLDSSAQVLLARVDGKPEMVVIGKIADDRQVYVEPSSGLKVHRKACSGLVFYEINTLNDDPVIKGVQAPGCR